MSFGPNTSVAVYCANFGNYRKEVAEVVNHSLFTKGIDYYFYTDDIKFKIAAKKISSKHWKVMHVALKGKAGSMSPERHTSKHVKWILPKILHKYDIVVWIDSKSVKHMNFSKGKLLKLFNSRKSAYFIKHPHRHTAQQELRKTTHLRRRRRHIEHPKHGRKFLEEIKRK